MSQTGCLPIDGHGICRMPIANVVLLHAFIKKTQQTLENDLNLVVKRQKEVEGGKAAK